ncbi:hypothetical protein TNCV_4835691 [Trichonephila clavipes]|nr:hypothetical protein TNCV_4835691 [Trichonephila clavipes]
MFRSGGYSDAVANSTWNKSWCIETLTLTPILFYNRNITEEVRFFPFETGSIPGESPTSFPEEDKTMPYSGFEPEPTRLQAKGHIHHTNWAAMGAIKVGTTFGTVVLQKRING